MKRRKKINDYSIIILFIFMIAMIGAIVAVNIIFLKKENWVNLLIDLMGELLSAIVIGLFLGLITKIITQKLFSIQINMKKMREMGIDGVGTGISTKDDINKMFGATKLKKDYPYAVKLMFITGNIFLKTFQSQIAKCMDEGCEIQLLIASPEDFNKEYLDRISFRYNNGEIDYQKEIIEDSLKTVRDIKNLSKNPEKLKVRFYLDEYQNNIRISKYIKSENHEISYYWINLQPLNKPAIDLSIALKGEIDNLSPLTNENDNLCYATERGFDLLWDKYESTEKIWNSLQTVSRLNEVFPPCGGMADSKIA